MNIESGIKELDQIYKERGTHQMEHNMRLKFSDLRRVLNAMKEPECNCGTVATEHCSKHGQMCDCEVQPCVLHGEDDPILNVYEYWHKIASTWKKFPQEGYKGFASKFEYECWEAIREYAESKGEEIKESNCEHVPYLSPDECCVCCMKCGEYLGTKEQIKDYK